jgi:hypothetical protein
MVADMTGVKAGPRTAEPRAWPFLVARGRDRGYRTLLAPDFLVAERGYGVLDDSVVPSDREDQGDVVDVVTGTGRALTVVHATHVLTAADLAEPGAESGAESGAEAGGHEPRDRHSRPLALIYGFVCADARVTEVDPADLVTCRETALGVYRRFLGDEAGFTLEAGREFAPRTHLTRPAPVPSRRPAPVPSRRPAPVLAGAGGGSVPPRPAPGPGNLLLLGTILLVVVVAFLMWFAAQKPQTSVICPIGSASIGQAPDRVTDRPAVCGP